jgi:predicted transcriptional regulator
MVALVLKVQKSKDRKKQQHNTHYDAIYDALIYLSHYPIPLTKHRISTNKNVLSSLLSKQFISPVNDKDLLINNRYENVTHYSISQKGIEYIKLYESLQQLLV